MKKFNTTISKNNNTKFYYSFIVVLMMIFPFHVFAQFVTTGEVYVQPQGIKYISMDYFIKANGTYTNNGTTYILNNWTNNGVVDFSPLLHEGETQFIGVIAQQKISGTGVTKFQNVLFNNPMPNHAFQLECEINIYGDANFSHGIIGSDNTSSGKIIFQDNATHTNTSNSSFVDGPVQKTGNDEFTFPIGDAGFYRYAAISAPQNTTDSYSAQYFFSQPVSPGLISSGITNIDTAEYWVIEEITGNSNVEITLSWDTEETTPAEFGNNPKLVIARWDAAQLKWIAEGGQINNGSTATAGSITTVPDKYGIFTLALTDVTDTDNDGVADNIDIDDDNDGILDTDEGDGTVDTDGDGIPDSLDIDSDNDGIPDNVEGQVENSYTPPTGNDTDNDGWDDAYDSDNGGTQFTIADTDSDQTPDYLDSDSDNDGIPDNIEGNDQNFDGFADVIFSGVDTDNDGLDDVYDTVNGWGKNNSTGSNAPTQNFDGDDMRDWRDIDDDNDGKLSTIEGDSYEDKDHDGYPNYLDVDEECTQFIPEGFSPNGDNVNDFFIITCLQDFPNAIFEVYNRWGVLVYKLEGYGNEAKYGTDAWWNGKSNQTLTVGSEKLSPGTYFYILNLRDSNKTPIKGPLFLNYGKQ